MRQTRMVKWPCLMHGRAYLRQVGESRVGVTSQPALELQLKVELSNCERLLGMCIRPIQLSGLVVQRLHDLMFD